METDKDHIHYMIETEPTMSVRRNRKLNEKLYDIPYMGKIFKLFAKTVLERTYLLDRWIFCLYM